MKLTQPEQELHEFLVQTSLHTGANMLLSQVIATLFAHPEAMSLEELSERTGYSLASVSNAVRLLEQAGKIVRHKKPGDKRTYISFHNDLIKNTHEHINKALNVFVKPFGEKIPGIISGLEQEAKNNKHDSQKKQELKQKKELLASYVAQMKHIEKVFVEIDKLFDGLEHGKKHH
jgi:DNA-binding transcriptional regulator GbsR (MarR family)